MLDGAEQIAIEKSIEVARQSALNANFGGTTFPSLACAADHFIERERVRVRGCWPPAKTPEKNTPPNNLCEILVAIYRPNYCIPTSISPIPFFSVFHSS